MVLSVTIYAQPGVQFKRAFIRLKLSLLQLCKPLLRLAVHRLKQYYNYFLNRLHKHIYILIFTGIIAKKLKNWSISCLRFTFI